MKKSELIKRLQDEIEAYGDCHIKSVKVYEESAEWSRNMTSPIRKDKHGNRANMNQKEFEEYCKNNPIKQEKHLQR